MEIQRDKRYTYADYLAWEDGKRYELIDGVPYMMSAPSVDHQRISGALFSQLYSYLRGKSCEVFASPFDVRLNADKEDDTVVQPDITVVYDPKKTENGQSCKGPPDMVVEILSPSTAIYDQNVKLDKYLAAGVREYWVVNPDEKSVQVYLFENGKGLFQVYKGTAVVPVQVLEACVVDLTGVFPQQP